MEGVVKMKSIVKLIVVGAIVFGFMAGNAVAKDEVLVQDMVDLELTYIPPLFHTNKKPENVDISKKALTIYRAEWDQFSADYADYRSDEENWGSYFRKVENAIVKAEDIVFHEYPNVPLVEAHEALEAVRAAFLELRSRNGFPKFITDKMTAFHDPMENMVLSLMGKTPDQIDEDLMLAIGDALREALFTWDKVQKCPIDQAAWGFSDAKMAQIADYIASERVLLDTFVAAYNSGDKATMLQTAMPIKSTFVALYTRFGDFAALMN